MTCGFRSGPHSWHPIKLTKQAKFKLLAEARHSMSCVIKMSLFIFNDFQLPWQQPWVTRGGGRESPAGCRSREVGPRVMDVPVPCSGASAWCHLPLQQQIRGGRMRYTCGRAAGLISWAVG